VNCTCRNDVAVVLFSAALPPRCEQYLWWSRQQQTAKKRSPCLGVARVFSSILQEPCVIAEVFVHPFLRAWCAIDQKFLGDENQLSKDQDLALLVQSDAVGQHDFKLAASSSSVSKKKTKLMQDEHGMHSLLLLLLL